MLIMYQIQNRKIEFEFKVLRKKYMLMKKSEILKLNELKTLKVEYAKLKADYDLLQKESRKLIVEFECLQKLNNDLYHEYREKANIIRKIRKICDIMDE
jgi:hypothetical protein